MKLERFDKKSAKTIGTRAAALLKALGDEIGADVVYAGGLLDEGEFKCKVSFRLREVGGMDRERAAWNRDCAALNLRPEDFGATIVLPDGKARLIGIKPGKRPVVFEFLAIPGKRYVIEDGTVRRALGRCFEWERSAS